MARSTVYTTTWRGPVKSMTRGKDTESRVPSRMQVDKKRTARRNMINGQLTIEGLATEQGDMFGMLVVVLCDEMR